MTLEEFLKEVNGSETSIIEYKGEEALEVVKINGHMLKYIREQTQDICLAAVRENGDALKYVREQTQEICLVAVKQIPRALLYVDKSIFEKSETK